MERRYLPNEECPVSLEKRDDTPTKIVGRAAVFYDGTPDTEYTLYEAVMDGERVLQPALIERISNRAFNKAINDKHDVRALFNHDPNLVLGRTSSRTLTLTKSLRGLDYEIEPGKTTVANDVQEHIRRGDVTGSSFGFSVRTGGQKFYHDSERGVDVREITDLDLFDVSPVTFPAYSSTSTGVRSETDHMECRSAYESWRTSALAGLEASKATVRRLAEIKERRDAIAKSQS
jgi:hypothetical protein